MVNEADRLPALTGLTHTNEMPLGPGKSSPERSHPGCNHGELERAAPPREGTNLSPPADISREPRSPFLYEDEMSGLELTSCVTLLKSLYLSGPVSSFEIGG